MDDQATINNQTAYQLKKKIYFFSEIKISTREYFYLIKVKELFMDRYS